MAGHADAGPGDALRRELARRGFTLVGADPPSGGRQKVQAEVVQQVPTPSGDSLYVPLPVEIVVTLDAGGAVRDVTGGIPAPDAVAAAGDWVRTLVENHQLALPGQPLGAGVTHEVVTDPDGRRIVRRRRFAGR